jgi:hypothetical protein
LYRHFPLIDFDNDSFPSIFSLFPSYSQFHFDLLDLLTFPFPSPISISVSCVRISFSHGDGFSDSQKMDGAGALQTGAWNGHWGGMMRGLRAYPTTRRFGVLSATFQALISFAPVSARRDFKRLGRSGADLRPLVVDF